MPIFSSCGQNEARLRPDPKPQPDDVVDETGHCHPVKFKLGIRFEKLQGDFTDHTASRTKHDWISKRHWALVFTHADPPHWSFRVELMPVQKTHELTFRSQLVDDEICAHPIGMWTGHLDEVVDLVSIHPMLGTKYSPPWNNCQHWAATLLLLLRAFSTETPERRLDVTHPARASEVLAVLKKEGESVYHDSNLAFHAAHLMGMGGSAGVFGAVAVAAEATTVVSVPATGLAAFFGAAPSLAVIPAAGAGAAAAALPMLVGAMGVTFVAGGTFLVKNGEWKKKSMFRDPRIGGLKVLRAGTVDTGKVG